MNLPLNDDAAPDRDLRALFASQRAADRAEAPAWSDGWLQGSVNALRRSSSVVWRPALLAAACAVVLGLLLALPPGSKTQPRLSEVLPPLFEEPAGTAAPELFASLESSFLSAQSPSDFLLPDSLSPSATSSSSLNPLTVP